MRLKPTTRPPVSRQGRQVPQGQADSAHPSTNSCVRMASSCPSRRWRISLGVELLRQHLHGIAWRFSRGAKPSKSGARGGNDLGRDWLPAGAETGLKHAVEAPYNTFGHGIYARCSQNRLKNRPLPSSSLSRPCSQRPLSTTSMSPDCS